MESLEFVFDSHRYGIAERRWRGTNDQTRAEFSFFEDGTEVFAIHCLVSSDAHGVRYEVCEVATFDMRANWAKALLGFYATKLLASDRACSDTGRLRTEGVETGLRQSRTTEVDRSSPDDHPRSSGSN